MWKPIGSAIGRPGAPPSANIGPDRVIFYDSAVTAYDLRSYTRVCVYTDEERGEFAIVFHSNKSLPGRLMRKSKKVTKQKLFVSLNGAKGTFLPEDYRVKVKVAPAKGTGLRGLVFVFPLKPPCSKQDKAVTARTRSTYEGAKEWAAELKGRPFGSNRTLE